MLLIYELVLLLMSTDPLQIFAGVIGILGALVLVVIGILVIILVVGALIVFLPAIIVAIIVWFFTGSFFLAGIAFLVVAIISLVAV
jgi:hypothetical protein